MHYNYKLDEQAINNIIKRHIKLVEKQKQIKFIIYYTKFKTSYLLVKNITKSAKIHLNQTNLHVYFDCVSRKIKIIFILVIQLQHNLVATLITFLKIAPLKT